MNNISNSIKYQTKQFKKSSLLYIKNCKFNYLSNFNNYSFRRTNAYNKCSNNNNTINKTFYYSLNKRYLSKNNNDQALLNNDTIEDYNTNTKNKSSTLNKKNISMLLGNNATDLEKEKANHLLDTSIMNLRQDINSKNYSYFSLIECLSFSENCNHEPLIIELEDIMIKYLNESYENRDKLFNNFSVYEKLGFYSQLKNICSNRFKTKLLEQTNNLIRYIDISTKESLNEYIKNLNKKSSSTIYVNDIFFNVYETYIYFSNNKFEFNEINIEINNVLTNNFNKFEEDSKINIALKGIFYKFSNKWPLFTEYNYLIIINYLKLTINEFIKKDIKSIMYEDNTKNFICFQLFPKMCHDFILLSNKPKNSIEGLVNSSNNIDTNNFNINTKEVLNEKQIIKKQLNDTLNFVKKIYMQLLQYADINYLIPVMSNSINYLGHDYDIIYSTILKINWNIHDISYDYLLEVFFSALKVNINLLVNEKDANLENSKKLNEYKICLSSILSIINKNGSKTYNNTDKTIEGFTFRDIKVKINEAFMHLSKKRNKNIAPSFKKLVIMSLQYSPYSGYNYIKEIEIIYENYLLLELHKI